MTAEYDSIQAMGPTPGAEAPVVFLYGEVTSVFDPAWELYKAKKLHVWGSVLAESQTKGRGRAGRPWVSPPGHVYAALRLPMAAPFDGPSASVALALFVSMALEELFPLKVSIKWPNDIILEGKKIGGLLLEARQGAVIAGIGLNLVSPPIWAPAEPGLDNDHSGPGPNGGHGNDTAHWAHTCHTGLVPHAAQGDQGNPVGWLPSLPAGALPVTEGPGELWPKLVEKTLVCYNLQMANHEQSHFGAESIMGLAKERLLGLGQKIAIRSPSTEPPFHGRVLAGTLVGLDSTGALLIEKDGCVYAAWSGSLFFCL